MQVVFQSDIGKTRKNNQDFAGQFDNQAGLRLVVVCDGMGGHKAGDVASEMAVSHLGHAWEETNYATAEEVTQWMLKQITLENERIVGKSTQFSDLDGMGTTLVAAVLFEEELVIANIGDSRGYLYSNKKLVQLTEDHSLVNELLKSGEITSEASAISEILSQDISIEEKVNALVSLANEKGGADNITVLLADFAAREES